MCPYMCRYERNKHIFPASRWETYDPQKKFVPSPLFVKTHAHARSHTHVPSRACPHATCVMRDVCVCVCVFARVRLHHARAHALAHAERDGC